MNPITKFILSKIRDWEEPIFILRDLLWEHYLQKGEGVHGAYPHALFCDDFLEQLKPQIYFDDEKNEIKSAQELSLFRFSEEILYNFFRDFEFININDFYKDKLFLDIIRKFLIFYPAYGSVIPAKYKTVLQDIEDKEEQEVEANHRHLFDQRIVECKKSLQVSLSDLRHGCLMLASLYSHLDQKDQEYLFNFIFDSCDQAFKQLQIDTDEKNKENGKNLAQLLGISHETCKPISLIWPFLTGHQRERLWLIIEKFNLYYSISIKNKEAYLLILSIFQVGQLNDQQRIFLINLCEKYGCGPYFEVGKEIIPFLLQNFALLGHEAKNEISKTSQEYLDYIKNLIEKNPNQFALESYLKNYCDAFSSGVEISLVWNCSAPFYWEYYDASQKEQLFSTIINFFKKIINWEAKKLLAIVKNFFEYHILPITKFLNEEKCLTLFPFIKKIFLKCERHRFNLALMDILGQVIAQLIIKLGLESKKFSLKEYTYTPYVLLYLPVHKLSYGLRVTIRLLAMDAWKLYGDPRFFNFYFNIKIINNIPCIPPETSIKNFIQLSFDNGESAADILKNLLLKFYLRDRGRGFWANIPTNYQFCEAAVKMLNVNNLAVEDKSVYAVLKFENFTFSDVQSDTLLVEIIRQFLSFYPRYGHALPIDFIHHFCFKKDYKKEMENLQEQIIQAYLSKRYLFLYEENAVARIFPYLISHNQEVFFSDFLKGLLEGGLREEWVYSASEVILLIFPYLNDKQLQDISRALSISLDIPKSLIGLCPFYLNEKHQNSFIDSMKKKTRECTEIVFPLDHRNLNYRDFWNVTILWNDWPSSKKIDVLPYILQEISSVSQRDLFYIDVNYFMEIAVLVIKITPHLEAKDCLQLLPCVEKFYYYKCDKGTLFFGHAMIGLIRKSASSERELRELLKTYCSFHPELLLYLPVAEFSYSLQTTIIHWAECAYLKNKDPRFLSVLFKIFEYYECQQELTNAAQSYLPSEITTIVSQYLGR